MGQALNDLPLLRLRQVRGVNLCFALKRFPIGLLFKRDFDSFSAHGWVCTQTHARIHAHTHRLVCQSHLSHRQVKPTVIPSEGREWQPHKPTRINDKKGNDSIFSCNPSSINKPRIHLSRKKKKIRWMGRNPPSSDLRGFWVVGWAGEAHVFFIKPTSATLSSVDLKLLHFPSLL